jgi:hypothetical protein
VGTWPILRQRCSSQSEDNFAVPPAAGEKKSFRRNERLVNGRHDNDSKMQSIKREAASLVDKVRGRITFLFNFRPMKIPRFPHFPPKQQKLQVPCDLILLSRDSKLLLNLELNFKSLLSWLLGSATLSRYLTRYLS